MSAAKVAPCPVCGATPTVRGKSESLLAYAYVSCGGPYAMHYVRVLARTKRDAISRWNKAFKPQRKGRA